MDRVGAVTVRPHYEHLFPTRVTPLKLLWVNADVAGLREAWTSEFARHCDVHEIESSELSSADADGDWDLVCFNFDYPEMTTLRLIPNTKKRWPSVPILMLTMQNSADIALWALRSRVFDLLIKPIAAEEVDRCMERVQGALQARRSQTERSPHAMTTVQMPAETRYRPQLAVTPRLQNAIAHVAKHFAQHISESELALLCEMSPSRFCREFKAAFGVTFVEYVSNHRISEAKRLLVNPGISVTDVAMAVGFGDPSYFTRVFRRQEGVSPSEYRTSAAGAECRSQRAIG
jgi:YesN/AraC family two-component response regulator